MKKSIDIESDDVENRNEIENFIANTLNKMSNDEMENSSSASVTPDEVAWQIRVVTGPAVQPLVYLFELKR